MTQRNRDTFGAGGGAFPPTHWSAIEDKSRHKTLTTELFEQYRDPLYIFLMRKKYSREDARDLVQDFLADILLERDFLSLADKRRGKFRSLLLKSFTKFISRKLRKKRVGEVSLSDMPTYDVPELVPNAPEAAFDFAWAMQLMAGVLYDLEHECTKDGLRTHWCVFRDRLQFEGPRAPSLSVICEKYDIASKQKASNSVQTVLRRFKRLVIRRVEAEMAPGTDPDRALADFLSIFGII